MSASPDNEFDVLDMLGEPTTPITQTAPQQQYNKPYNNKSNYNKGPNLWEDVDVKGISIDTNTFAKVGKSFAFVTSGKDVTVPADVVTKLKSVAAVLAKKGYSFRCGGELNPVYNEIMSVEGLTTFTYLPFKKFNAAIDDAKVTKPTPLAYGHAAQYHKAFKKLPNVVRAILARDVHIILDSDCKNPVNILLCYSEDGIETAAGKIDYKTAGNLSFYLTLTDISNTAVFNFKKQDVLNRLTEYLKTLS